ncbi:MAG: chemotaxis protein CheW [Comamonadaceae bacterium]|jgi:purine-binding chemotaxis protein CheW|nr:chemotaxis protein CheW [Comamonadaceae bacterium]
MSFSTSLSTSSPRAASATASGQAQPQEFLVFHLGQEVYGVDILHVQEIRSYEAPTRLAHAPASVLGVINLRGVIVPIIDLRLQLGCEDLRYDDTTVVIVLNVAGRVLGAVVDAVADVVALPAQALRPAPQFAGDPALAYVRAIADVEGRMLILVDIAALLGSTRLAELDTTAIAATSA